MQRPSAPYPPPGDYPPRVHVHHRPGGFWRSLFSGAGFSVGFCCLVPAVLAAIAVFVFVMLVGGCGILLTGS